jgi:hypothetical protein
MNINRAIPRIIGTLSALVSLFSVLILVYFAFDHYNRMDILRDYVHKSADFNHDMVDNVRDSLLKWVE